MPTHVDPRRLVGILGMLLAAIFSQFNDTVISTALSDIAGGYGISNDPASWLRTVYVNGEVIGMVTGPTLGMIFSVRRFAMFAVAFDAAITLLMLAAPDAGTLIGLRFLQGVAGGFIIPLLMATVLRNVPLALRVYGLATYALTAVFTPNLATAVAALWLDGMRDYRFVFLEAIPLASVSILLIWWGLQQDEPKSERLRTFDWQGAILIGLAFGSLSILFEQADRLDWFNSPVVCVLALVAVVSIPWSIARELGTAFPLVHVQLLLRRNVAFGIVFLTLFLASTTSGGQIPGTFLAELHGFRPLQSFPMTAWIAAAQIVLLPMVAWLLNHRHVDCRWVCATGVSLLLISCIGKSLVAPDWMVAQFMPWQAIAAIGYPMTSLPLLLMITNSIQPAEGIFAAAFINGARALAEAFSALVITISARWRGGLHETRILEDIGNERLRLIQAAALPGGAPPPLTPIGTPSAPGSLEALNGAVSGQVATMVTADQFLVIGGVFVMMLVVIAILPQRTYPPIYVFGHPGK